MSFKHIITIHGVPRSGTSWLGQIIDSSPEVRFKFQPLFSYAFKDRIGIRSDLSEINKFFDEVYHYNDDFLDQKDQVKKGNYPTFDCKDEEPEMLVLKEVRYHYLIPHLLQTTENTKTVVIVRHPCGSLNSWKNAPREFHPEWNFLDEWRFAQSKNQFRPEEYFGFQRWLEFAKLALCMEKKYPERFKLVKYEELVSEPLKVTADIFRFCNLNLTKQTMDFLAASTSTLQEDTYSVFRNNKDVDDWKASLDEEVINIIYKELTGTEFEIFLNKQ
jgi:hypothetical protein